MFCKDFLSFLRVCGDSVGLCAEFVLQFVGHLFDCLWGICFGVLGQFLGCFVNVP